MAETLKRRSYSCILETVTPLHLGSGETRDGPMPDIEVLRKGTKETRKVAVAAIQRDFDAKPYLPGSGLKGALRRSADGRTADLFGVIADFRGHEEREQSPRASSEPGRMGALLVRGARWVSGGDGDGFPFAANATFIHARSKIDPGRGTSETNKLFHTEMVLPGSRFKWEFRLETRGDIDALAADLKNALAVWAAERGVAIGADRSADLGRIRLLKETLTQTDWRIEGGRLVADDTSGPVTLEDCDAPEPAAQLTLFCEDPFLTRDTGWTAKEIEDEKLKGNIHPPHIRALRHHDQPLVLATLVTGALRGRARWLLACEAYTPGMPPPDRAETIIREPSEAHRLTAEERLFGTAGWQSPLRVSVTKAARTSDFISAQARIDRFSGGTMDSALFKIDADHGVRLTVSFWLDEERATPQGLDLLGKVLADVRLNGLDLGHGSTKGYGWFRVEES